MQNIDDTVVSMIRDLTYSRFVFYWSVYAFSTIERANGDVRALATPHSASIPFFSVVLDQGQIGLKVNNSRKLRCVDRG